MGAGVLAVPLGILRVIDRNKLPVFKDRETVLTENNLQVVGVDDVIVRDPYRQGEGHLPHRPVGYPFRVVESMVRIAVGRKVLVNLREVRPLDGAEPDVGLVVGGGAAPAVAGAGHLARANAFGILLPGDAEADALGAVDHHLPDVAAARGQPFGLEPHDVADLEILVGHMPLTSSSSASVTITPRQVQRQ
jgi:hypothetical protein